MDQENVKAVLGPVWTHWGFRYWRLYLHEHALVVYPYTSWESFREALRLYMGRYSPEPLHRVSGVSYTAIPGGRFRVRRYEISLTRKIEIISSYMRNKICIEKISGERHTYVIPVRPQTDLYRRKLRELYPNIYAERNFPRTWLGRLLKR